MREQKLRFGFLWRAKNEKRNQNFFDDCGGRFSFCRCTVGAKYRESNAGKKDLGQAVITKDSTSKKNIGMQLSYAEKMDILSASPNQLYLFKTKNKNQLLEYDGKFFEKLNTQLKKFTELKIMDFSRLSKNLEKSFKQASYYSIQQEYGTNGFPIWILSFSYKNSDYWIGFDLALEKILYFSAEGGEPLKFLTRNHVSEKAGAAKFIKRIKRKLEEYYGAKWEKESYSHDMIARLILVQNIAVFSNKNNSVVPVRTVIWENPTAGKYSNIKISLGGIASEDDFDMSGSLYSNGYADSSTSSTMK